jgi:hypothetical protein
MTDYESLERSVSADPQRLPDHMDEIRRKLGSDDVHKRADAGRALRAVAEADATLLEPYHELIVDLLSDRNGSLQLSGLVGVAGLAEVAPERVEHLVPTLTALLERSNAPAIEQGVIKALTRLGESTPGAVADADALLADRLRTATTPIRLSLVTVFASAVIERPSAFPELVRAFETALAEDDAARVRRYAASTLSLVAAENPGTLSSVEDTYERVVELDAKVNGGVMQERDENLTEAVARLERVMGDVEGVDPVTDDGG